MALQSEVSPPIVGDPNKDTKNDGDTKSDDNESTSSTDEEVDLEEGEILDSGAEEEEEKKDLTNSSLQEALDKNFLNRIEQLVSQAKADVSPPNVPPKTLSPHNSPVKINKRSNYVDHDRFESGSDQEDGWYSPSRKQKSKFDSKPIDYRKELDAYIGTPPSSPDRHKDKRKKSTKKSKKSTKKTSRRKEKSEYVKKMIKEAMKRKICRFFKEGKCHKGADCGFSHSSPSSYKKRELCKFYLSGHCNKGHDCKYMHSEFPCKFYHTGSECYAQDKCRFSHEPLTDEMKRVLADYLRMHRGDDDYDRKRRRSPSPAAALPNKPPSKRTCLLGSPPRHIREAEETKRWQEEMLHLQQGQHPSFKINIHGEEEGFPPQFQKPNFYQETLPDSPISQRRKNQEGPMFAPPPFGKRDIDDRFSIPSASDIFVYEEDYQDNDDDDAIDIKQEPQDFEWNDMPAINHDLPPMPHVKTEMQPYIVPPQQELDFTSDVKFDEATQFSESSTDCVPAHVSPKEVLQPPIKKEIEEDSSNPDVPKSENSKTSDDPLSTVEVPAVPIVVPSHLPKKQRELFMRIQQQELKHAITAAVNDASLSPKPFDTSDTLPKEDTEEVKPEVKKDDSVWYSSDDDDDDTEPLTNVLKNLQREPPAMKPIKTDTKPTPDLMAMLNRIQQKALEKNKGIAEPQQGGSFVQSLFGTISAPPENLPILGLSLPPSDFIRRTLLPDPKTLHLQNKIEPAVAPKDPRLKNRDPRLAATTASCLPKAAEPQISSSLPRSGLMTPAFINPISASSEPVKEEIPYKLHGIYTKPPNYASYITASQNNPSLLKDPRLRKHMNLAQNKVNGDEISKDHLKAPAKNAPPIPELLLKYNKNESLAINIFESSSSTKPTPENVPEAKPQLPKLLDPRMRRRESQNSSGSNTPPHLSIVESPPPQTVCSFKATPPVLEREVKPTEEKKWLPPLLEKSWTPPILEQSWTPPIKQEVDSDGDDMPLRLQIDESPPSTSEQVVCGSIDSSIKKKPVPASHLPRAIADPRMAKLQNPLHSRRSSRLSTPETSNKSPPELVKPTSPPNENSSDSSRLSPVALEPVDSKSAVSKPKNKKLSEEKKKTVHRNRKSSMDYASPLNSCDDSSNKSLNYNSYNQRPKRTCVTKLISESSVSSVTTNSVVGDTTPDFLSDNSNLDCENSDVNLKDMFKTIDPTASPFC